MSKRWENREGTPPEQRLKDLQEEMGLGNLVNNPISESFPDADKIKEGQFQLVQDSGSLYLVSKVNGQRVRMSFTPF